MTLEKVKQVLIDLKAVMEKSGRAEYEFQLVEIFHHARQAKEVLNTFIERLESDELVEKVAMNLGGHWFAGDAKDRWEADHVDAMRDETTDQAQSVIAVIKDMI